MKKTTNQAAKEHRMQNAPVIKCGDRVIYVKEPKKALKVISDPEEFCDMQVVTCEYLPPKARSKRGALQGLYDVTALEKVDGPP